MASTRITAHKPDVDLARIDATTEADIRRHMHEEGYDPDQPIPDEDIILAGCDPQAARYV